MESQIVAAIIGVGGAIILSLIAYVFYVDRLIHRLKTTVELLFQEKNHHCKEQKEACKDRFNMRCESCDKRFEVLESKL